MILLDPSSQNVSMPDAIRLIYSLWLICAPRNWGDCEAAQKNNSDFKCPSSRAPHHIRGGYITDQKNRGVSAEAIEQRCDVTPRVQKLHYDLPDDAEERERFEDEFRNADNDLDSGFNHD